ncbi:MAG: hypothetical protein COV57_02700 [Candidatus Liptonbacteria bacterium CG11_big_fil_rev_8_21_14_0_20_35_14]|uniref:Uncharacterized protein n=1 Tax=Candidatus Liptonbacteria bacterium CG11_big_fil_rev_8_21_14_0_20_35_14 TaxID=1974634 RepID=A0A2H0N790_9BACT|nr:MAG: hypothetical protein COV57_02700 [Candidatus Liptonbacteria bacterium CG11_big_fil_rev_8_21_14_0_20_35_14]
MRVRFLPGAHFRKWQARGSRLASLGGHFVLNFGGKNELAVSQNMVRADVFQKCCHFGKIILLNQFCGLIQRQNELTSLFEPRQTFLLKVSDFFV